MNNSLALHNHIQNYLRIRKNQGLLRELTSSPVTHHPNDVHLNLNDYLQLNKHPHIIKAAQHAIKTWGTSSSGSPAVGSFWLIHQELETKLKEWCGFNDGLLWSSGYAANNALLSTLAKKGDIILADRYVHNSVLLSTKETRAKLIRYHHLDLNHLETLLRLHTRADRTVFVVTESVFSMDGDYPDFNQMSSLKERYSFFWIVDEAHALGWYGPKGNGLIAQFGIQKNVDVLVATLGKTLVSQGAITLFHEPHLRSYLINRTPQFIYSTYLTPAATAASMAAIDVIQTEYLVRQPKWLADTLMLKNRLKHFFPRIPLYDSPILPLIIGDPNQTLYLAAELAKRHLYVGAIRPPSVPKGTDRLRLSLHCNVDFDALSQMLVDFFSSPL